MKFYKFISIILHPIVIPTLGVILYFLLIPNNFGSNQKMQVLELVFVITFLIPLFILILLKKVRLIKSFNLESIKSRKILVAVMILLFYFLARTLQSIPSLIDLGWLFYAASLGLVFIYILFIFRVKASIHLLSLGVSTGFFIVLANLYSINFIIIIIVFLFFSGLLASARLHLKAHIAKEVYLGFFLGFVAPFLIHYIL